MAQVTLEIHGDEALEKTIRAVDRALGDGDKVFREFSVYMRQATDNMFEKLGHGGGTHRGVTWAPFADQYTQKTTGVIVPAWGGVPKVHSGGLVKGRKRPSGTRLKAGDALMQDTNTLRGAAALVVQRTTDLLRMGPQGVSYAAAQQEMRPFLFFVKGDAKVLNKIAEKHLKRATGH